MRWPLLAAMGVAVLFGFQIHAAQAEEALFSAVRNQDLPSVATMVARGSDINARNAGGQTPLMVASTLSNSVRLMEQLVMLGADLRARDNNGMTALMHAAATGQLENAEQLLLMGIDPDIRDKHGKTVLEHAQAGGLNQVIGNTPSFVSMLEGKNHKGTDKPAYAIFIPYQAGAFTPTEFEKAVIHAMLRKGWGISEISSSRVQVFYPRIKRRQLFKAEVVVEPARIVIRYRPGYGYQDDQTYLEGIRASLMYELAMY